MERRQNPASASQGQKRGDIVDVDDGDNMDVDYDPEKGLPDEHSTEEDKMARADPTVPESPELRGAWLARIKDMSVMELNSLRTAAIIEVHQKIRAEFPDAKIVIFSKYLKYLDILEAILTVTRATFTSCGLMGPKAA